MAHLVPRNFWTLPTQNMSSIFDEVDELLSQGPSGTIGLSEDDKNVYVEVAIPGIDPDDVEVTYDRGILWVRGQAREEQTDKSRKFYRRAASEFSYRIAVPGEVDQNARPEAECKNGIVTVIFPKDTSLMSKKIPIKKLQSNGHKKETNTISSKQIKGVRE